MPAKRTFLRAATSLLVLVTCLASAHAGGTIKLASIFPDGSIWDKAFDQMGASWKKDTGGKVKLRIYPGGVAGDEPDIVRKMRIGQLSAASLTIGGLGELDESFRVFEAPFLYESFEEILYVVEKMTPTITKRLDEKGFVLLHWGHGGWIRTFSTKPVERIEDLKALKQFVWAGDNRMIGWWKENGFQPVPLAATDIATGLQTGLIEAVPTTPLAALSLQWFRSTPYMLDLPVVPYLGATVMTKKAWDKLSDEEQASVKRAASVAQDTLFTEVPKQEVQAVNEMKKRGLTVTELDAAQGLTPWQDAGKKFADRVRATNESAELFDAALRFRDEFRAK